MSQANNRSSPRKNNNGWKPPTSKKARRRTTAPQHKNPNTAGPGKSGDRPNGDAAISKQIGSTRPSGSISVRAAIKPNRGCPANSRSARGKASLAHHESSSQNATYGVRARRTPKFRATAPKFRPNATTDTRGKLEARRTDSSDDPLSTTTTGTSNAASRPNVRVKSATRSRVAITTVVPSTAGYYPSNKWLHPESTGSSTTWASNERS